MKRFPDPKQFYNNWKNDMSLSPATNQKPSLFRAAATLPSAQGGLRGWEGELEKRAYTKALDWFVTTGAIIAK